ncbi:hypothetical protein MNBD_CHLOROFLEXI01-621 [hydrothermal vent metagenome]|uniref:Uncharacterized protein n=1 Tax=hydrothermal vent metagenome TaxID=652676 RepID=A0A3B0V9L4_9ZZZZ
MEPSSKIKLREPLIILVIIVLLFYWALNALNTENALWFFPVQPTLQPARIIVRNYGQTVELQPGSPGFSELVKALDDTFASGFNNTSLVSIGLSDETLRRYAEEELVIESYYGDAVSFNTQVRMTNVTQLLIPLEGTHADQRYLFFGGRGEWRVGAMVMSDDSPLRTAMQNLGYLGQE